MRGVALLAACFACPGRGYRVRIAGERFEGRWNPKEKSEPLESLHLLSSPNPTSGWQVAGVGAQRLQGISTPSISSSSSKSGLKRTLHTILQSLTMAQEGLAARNRSRSPRRATEFTGIEKVTTLCKAVEHCLETALEKAEGRSEDVVVVLDLDETCFTANTDNALATSAWFDNLMQRWVPILQAEAAMNHAETLMECLAVVDCFYSFVAAKLTEEALPDLLEKCKADGIATIGLTARTPVLAPVTWQQLGKASRLVFDSLSPPWDLASVKALEKSLKSNGHAAPNNPDAWEGICQDRGVWFTANANKGAMLRQILKAGSHVVFADDSERHLHDVKAALDGHAASVYLLHYTTAKDSAKDRLDVVSCDSVLADFCTALYEKRDSAFMKLVQTKQRFLSTFISRQLQHLEAKHEPVSASLKSLAASLL